MKLTFLIGIQFLLLGHCFGQKLTNEIMVFETKAQAVNFVFNDWWNFLDPVVNKKKYEKVDAIVEELWPYFCERYKNCADYPKPEIILTHGTTSGSFGTHFQGKQRQSNGLIISQELLQTPDDLAFVLAHEMTHYFEKHAESVHLTDEIKAIKRNIYGKCLDYPFPLEELKDDLLELMKTIDHIGESPQLISSHHGIPIEGEFGKLIEGMIERTRGLDTSCFPLESKYNDLKERIEQGNYISTMDQAAKDFNELAEKCFELYSGNLIKEVVERENLLTKSFDLDKWSQIEELIQKDKPEMSRLQVMRNLRYQKYLNLSRKLSAPQLRFFTEEDTADVVAIHLLLRAGRKNMMGHLDYLLTYLPTDKQLRCYDDLQNNREPDYGALNTEHHDECWRIWRARELEEKLKSQSSN